MSRHLFAFAVAVLHLAGSVADAQGARRGFRADSSLAFLAPLMGAWQPLGLPDSLMRLDPPIVGHSYRWTVGGKAVELRESYRHGRDSTSLLHGLIYWNPATELVEFVAVAGHAAGQGRYFRGEYRQLEDGAIERVYDVFYRTLGDVPAEQLGGLRRRYREVYRLPTPDSLSAVLDWYYDGAWRPFGAFARHSFRRIPRG